MGLTRDFRETVMARARRDPEFRCALLVESIQCFMEGDVETGKAVLRNYINATIGFDELSSQTGKPAKSLMRMFGPNGNPQAHNLFEVISNIQQHEGIHLEVTVGAASDDEPGATPESDTSSAVVVANRG